MPTTTAIIVAAGSSRRMGFDKLFADLDGRPVLRRTLDAFEECPDIDGIIVVTAAQRRETILGWKTGGACGKLAAVIEGGAQRHLSVAAALDHMAHTRNPAGNTLVAVHDGARPLITPREISACIEAAAAHGAAACARPLTETVKRSDGSGYVAEDVDRTDLWIMETPQVFQYQFLRDAYQEVLSRQLTVTDEVSAVGLTGVRTLLVDHSRPNLKITYPADLELAAQILRSGG